MKEYYAIAIIDNDFDNQIELGAFESLDEAKNARSYGRVKAGCDLSAKEFFECDYTLFALCVDTEKQRMTAGKTATQARMGEHNFFSLKKITQAAWKDTQKIKNYQELLLNLLKTPSLSGDGFDSARVVDEKSAVLKQP